MDEGDPRSFCHQLEQVTYLFLFSHLLFWFVLLGPHLWHVEVPRLGVELELQLLAYARSEPCLRPAPQLTETPEPQPTERDQGLNPCPYGYESGSLPLSHNGNSNFLIFKSMNMYKKILWKDTHLGRRFHSWGSR